MEDFDYIVVGAGSAGSVLAERLSSDVGNHVLLLEEGPDDDNWLLRMPKGIGKVLAETRYVSTYETTHKASPDGPNEIWQRGKTLGGSSSVNGMVWIHGQYEDFDRLAARGNPGWSRADMAPYFQRLEDHADYSDGDEGRGRGGPIKVKSHPNPNRLAEAFIAAGEGLGLRRKSNQNEADQEGVGYLQFNIDGRGRRVSSATGFLKQARSRPNLRIVTGARVDRILIENGRAVGVAATCGGQAVEYRTAGEVIVSAGAIASPKLLQLSGIGPAAHLQACGVPVVLDLAGVGRNLRDHWLLALNYRLRHASDSQNSAYSGLSLLRSVIRYLLTGTGVMTEGPYEAAAFVRSSADLNRPDGQVMFAPYSLAETKTGFENEPGMHVFAYLLRPESEGSIMIRGADAQLPPLIDPCYLRAEYDQKHSVALVHYMRAMMARPAMQKFVVGETERTSWAVTDEQILEAFRTVGRSGYHACGTCAMGTEPDAVVDERLRVRGIAGLRVADLSIYPEMPSGNTNAPVMAMALRGSDLILEDRRASRA